MKDQVENEISKLTPSEQAFVRRQIERSEALQDVTPEMIAKLKQQGQRPKGQPIQMVGGVKVSMNSQCPCGSGKKNKRCCRMKWWRKKGGA